MKKGREFLSVRQAAERSSLSSRFLYEACQRKELRFYRVGRRIVIDAGDLEEFIQRGVVEPEDWDGRAKELTK